LQLGKFCYAKFVAGPGIAPGPPAYETGEILLLYPAIYETVDKLKYTTIQTKKPE